MGGAERRLLTWAVAACALLLTLAGPALAAPPRAGARYDGRSATGQPVFVKVNRNANELSNYDLLVRMSCSDGRRRTLGLLRRGEGPTYIDPGGHFSYASPPEPVTYKRGKSRLSGTARTSFNGTFGSADVVSGTISTTFQGGGVSCSSGPVTYTAYRDGTRGAPFRRTNLATGLYTARGRGVSLRARAFAPTSRVPRARVLVGLRCRRSRGFGDEVSYGDIPLRGGAFRASDRSEFRVGSRRAFARARLRLRFRRSHGTYRVSGTVRVTATLRRGGRKVDTCTSGTRRFKGRLRSGPRNEF